MFSVSEFSYYPALLTDVTKFLLFARKQEVRGVHVDRPYYNVIPAMTVPNVHNPVMLDFMSDPYSQFQIYWTDDGLAGGQLGLHGANIFGTSFELLDSGTSNLLCLANNWGSIIFIFCVLVISLYDVQMPMNCWRRVASIKCSLF